MFSQCPLFRGKIKNGLQDILRGLYRAIRNPRSHEQIEDSKSTADAIIHFIDYLLSILAESRPPFTMDEFLAKVFDPDFVKSASYAELLVAEIPESKRLDALIQVYRDRDSGDGRALYYVVKAILEQLTEAQIESFFAVVSDELATTREEKSFRVTLQMLPAPQWPKVSEVARMRAEYKLVNSIRQGSYDPFTRNMKGALGTWACDFLEFFEFKTQIAHVFLEKLEGDYNERSYVARFFMSALPTVFTSGLHRDRCIDAICTAVIDGEVEMIDGLKGFFWGYPNDWKDGFQNRLEGLKESDPDLFTHFFGFEEDALPF